MRAVVTMLEVPKFETGKDKCKMPRVSACEPPCAICPLRGGQAVRTKMRRFTRDKRKAGESPGAFRSPGRVLLPAVRAVAGTEADVFLTEGEAD